MDDNNLIWSECAFCQENKDEKLSVPQNNPRDKTGRVAYKTISDILIYLRDTSSCDDMPSYMTENSTSGSICQLIQTNSAVWHKSCRLSYVGRYNKMVCRTKDVTESGEPPSKKRKLTRAVLNTEYSMEEDRCYFCSEPSSETEKLHSVLTKTMTNRVTAYAKKLNDSALLAKLSVGDLVAQEAKYHKKCITKLYNSVRDLDNSESAQYKQDDKTRSLVLAQLIDYMLDQQINVDTVKVFKLSELAHIYRERLEELGVECHLTNHNLKLKLLESCPMY